MVKGISRQVIVMHAPNPGLFEEAIFILKEDAVRDGITDDQLLKEANQVIHLCGKGERKKHFYLYGAVWACGGALLTGIVWVVTLFL